MNKKLKAKIMSIIVATFMVSTISGINVRADQDDKKTIQTSGYTIEKVSNPTSGQGQVDGIISGGDRNNSYAWAMTERNGYLYIGTNRNILGGVCQNFANQLQSYGLTNDQVWSVIDAITNGEIPKYDIKEAAPQIIKFDPKTGQTQVIYQGNPLIDMAYRMVVQQDGNIYFGTMGTVQSRIIKIDQNDKATVEFSAGQGSSFRAGTVYNGKVYFGGLDNRITGNGDYNKIAVLEKDQTDDSVWNRVADYKDFIDYASDNLYKNEGGNVWDLTEYNGELYIFLGTSKGFVVFKGHKANAGENANEYGWNWQEVIGKHSKYNMGMSDSAEGYSQHGQDGLIATAATPIVFKDKLYFGTMDTAVNSILSTVQGILAKLAGGQNTPSLSQIFGPMYTTLSKPQKMYSMDKQGNIEEVKGINDIYQNTNNEYFWRYAVYNNKLYVSSFDSSSLYYYVTKLTNGYISRMSKEELVSQIQYLIDCIKAFDKSGSTSSELDKLTPELELYSTQLKLFIEQFSTSNNQKELLANVQKSYDDIIAEINVLSSNVNIPQEEKDMIEKTKAKVQAIYNSLDSDGIKMYFAISDKMNNDNYGFDLYVTEDGQNYTPITTNGFNDKYNYGGRTLVATSSGLYVGTANPFYGAQIWRITDSSSNNNNNNNNDDSDIIPIHDDPHAVPNIDNTGAVATDTVNTDLQLTKALKAVNTGDSKSFAVFGASMLISCLALVISRKQKQI